LDDRGALISVGSFVELLPKVLEPSVSDSPIGYEGPEGPSEEGVDITHLLTAAEMTCETKTDYDIPEGKGSY